MTDKKEPTFIDIIVGLWGLALFAIYIWFVMLPYAVIHDWKEGTLFFNGKKCIKCGSTNIRVRGFEHWNRRWECIDCGHIVSEESL